MTAGSDQNERFEPLRPDQRNGPIDQMRGFAVLGFSYMLAGAYGLQHAAFYRLDIDSNSGLDWAAGIIGHLAFDLKASALLLLVLGAGIAHLLDRAAAHGKRPRRFLLWRTLLLVLIGVPPGVHAPLWEGNYHLFAAVFSVLTVLLYHRSPRTQAVVGVTLVILALALTPLFQSSFAPDGLGLSQYWWPDTHPYFDAAPIPDNHPTGYFIVTISLRVAGTTLLGSALYRYGIMQGSRAPSFYRRMALYGFLVGVPLAASSVLWMYLAEYRPTVAFIGHIPNSASAIPLALGYVSLFVLWDNAEDSGPFGAVKNGLEAVGRMALSNSVVFVTAGMFVIRDQLGRNYFSRWELAVIVAVAAALQMWWSSWWLRRFDYGPLEWLLRALTYRRPPRIRQR